MNCTERCKIGMNSARESFYFTKHHTKTLAYFLVPLLATISIEVILSFFSASLLGTINNFLIQGIYQTLAELLGLTGWTHLLGTFIVSFLRQFIIVFLTACLIHHVTLTIKDQEPSFASCLRFGINISNILVIWSVITELINYAVQQTIGYYTSTSATGFINTSFMSQVIGGLVNFGLFWLFFFVMTALVIENKSIYKAFLSSYYAMKNMFVQVICAELYFFMISFIVFMPVVFMAALFYYMFPELAQQWMHATSTPTPYALTLPNIIAWLTSNLVLVISAILGTIHTVLITKLYIHYIDKINFYRQSFSDVPPMAEL